MGRMHQKSVSGTQTLPEYAQRRKAPDWRGKLEREVMCAWANRNVRNRMINAGKVPIDSLVPKVKRADGTKILDPTALLAVNTTIQWLFGTNEGLATARHLLLLESTVEDDGGFIGAKSSKPVYVGWRK